MNEEEEARKSRKMEVNQFLIVFEQAGEDDRNATEEACWEEFGYHLQHRREWWGNREIQSKKEAG